MHAAAGRVLQHLHQPVRLPADGAHRDHVGEAVGRLQKGEHVPGRGRVDDDRVEVVAGAAFRGALLEVPDLAEHQDVFEAGRGRRDVVDEVAARECPRDALHVVLHAQVFGEGVFGDDRHAPHPGRELCRLVARHLRCEEPRECPFAVDFCQADFSATPGGDERERRGDRGLSHASFAGHDQDVRAQELVKVHSGMSIPSIRDPMLPRAGSADGSRTR